MPPAMVWVVLAEDGVDDGARTVCYAVTQADADRAVELLTLTQKSGKPIDLDPKMVANVPRDTTGAVGTRYWHDTARFYSRTNA